MHVMRFLMALVVLLVAVPVSAQMPEPRLMTCYGYPVQCTETDNSTPLSPSTPVQPSAPTTLERATVATLFASSSISMVPVWITAACTTDGTCREVNPVMRRFIGDGPVRAVVVKASVSGLAHYAIWRLPATTKKQRVVRLVAASLLLSINALDAVHDVRVFRRLEQRRSP